MSSAIPVTIAGGFSWTTIVFGILNVIGLGSVLVALIRTRPAMKKVAAEREANLLRERATEMESMRKQLAKIEAEQRRDRHKLNNVTQCLDSLLLMIELNPEKAAEAAAKVKAMRSDQLHAEATEMAAIHTATIQGDVS